jgi:Ca-activated chloride channel family protein
MLTLLALTLGARPAYAQDAFHTDLGGGELLTRSGEPLVLEHTSVFIEVSGGLAKVTMTQFFHNPFEDTVDVQYLFPLPEDAAVHGLDFTVGDRLIEGEVVTRAEAEERYQSAREQGRKAAVVDQQRSNLFTQRLSTICPDEDVSVTLQYVDPVDLEDGLYGLHVPLTVGPRWGAESATDAARISTVYTHSGGRGLDLSVVIDEGIPLSQLHSDSHEVLAADHPWGAELELDGSPALDRDFLLSWSLATDRPRAGLVAHRPDPSEPGWLSLTLEPQILEDYINEQPRELLFVLDTSGSMSGLPMEISKAAVREALEGMEPHDRFNIVRFSSSASSLFQQPQPASRANLQAAEQWLDRLGSGGGTDMSAGIRHSLAMPGDEDALRLVLMLTDGYIGNERQIFDRVQELRGPARMFSLGVGKSVNRYLLEGLAQAGRGDVAYMVDGDIQSTVDRWYERVAHPALSDIELDWGDLEVSEVQPSPVADLFVGQPLRVMARYEGSGEHLVTVRARVGSEPVVLRVPISLPEREPRHEALPLAFARASIESLEWQKNPEESIARVALEAGLVSRYTSLIAEDDSRAACQPSEASFQVPNTAPAGVDIQGAGGRVASHSPRTEIDFEELQVAGSLVQPQAALLLDRQSSQLSPMMRTWEAEVEDNRGQAARFSGSGARSDYVFEEETLVGEIRLPEIEIVTSRVRIEPPSSTLTTPPLLGVDALLATEPNEVAAVLRRYKGPITACYESAVHKEPELKGRLELQLVVEAGEVVRVEILRDEVGEGVAECIQRRARRWSFDAPIEGELILPFVFEPG